MKFLATFFMIIQASESLFTQSLSPDQQKDMIRYFRQGTIELQNGNYKVADSLLELSVLIKASTSNVYNYAISRLYLRDTVTYCKFMKDLAHIEEKDAIPQYFSICACADTQNFDRKFTPTEKKHSRYYEVTEKDRYLEYRYIHVHDRRKYRSTVASPLLLSISPTNILHSKIFAMYRVYPDGDTIFTLTSNPPELIGGEPAWDHFLESSRYISQAKEDLQLDKVWVMVGFVVDKTGNNRDDITIVSSNKTIEQTDGIKEYLPEIAAEIPKHNPGMYQGRRVNYYVTRIISFW